MATPVVHSLAQYHSAFGDVQPEELGSMFVEGPYRAQILAICVHQLEEAHFAVEVRWEDVCDASAVLAGQLYDNAEYVTYVLEEAIKEVCTACL